MVTNKETIFLIKGDALKSTIEDALKLKKDKENVATFTDRLHNQTFFVLTEEQFYLIFNSQGGEHDKIQQNK